MRNQIRNQPEPPVEIDYRGLHMLVTRKPIKNMYLRVKPPDGHLEISAPLRMRTNTIEKFVDSRRTWIDRMQERMVPVNPLDSSSPQERHSLGDNWPPERRAEAKIRMKAQLSELLPQWTATVGRTPTAISLRPMKTRWGSCTPRTGRIRLNLELADMPERFLEYVLVHELTHLRASGHGAEFQRLMSQYLPQWKTLRAELNHYVIL